MTGKIEEKNKVWPDAFSSLHSVQSSYLEGVTQGGGGALAGQLCTDARTKFYKNYPKQCVRHFEIDTPFHSKKVHFLIVFLFTHRYTTDPQAPPGGVSAHEVPVSTAQEIIRFYLHLTDSTIQNSTD